MKKIILAAITVAGLSGCADFRSDMLGTPRDGMPGARIGMRTDEVMSQTNWGRPSRVHIYTTARGTTEQWVYGDGSYLYFTNDVLTTIQQCCRRPKTDPLIQQ
ncbi:MAG TPA: lipoprotein [Herbaspirillum sp.]|jgi:uncharacterized protein YceK|nr:lipoprotein [Herbaspirillum sp.]